MAARVLTVGVPAHAVAEAVPLAQQAPRPHYICRLLGPGQVPVAGHGIKKVGHEELHWHGTSRFKTCIWNGRNVPRVSEHLVSLDEEEQRAGGPMAELDQPVPFGCLLGI